MFGIEKSITSNLLTDDHVTGYAATFAGNAKYCNFTVS